MRCWDARAQPIQTPEQRLLRSKLDRLGQALGRRGFGLPVVPLQGKVYRSTAG
jgi:hypothetical protein